jgi:serine/threonine protein kinase
MHRDLKLDNILVNFPDRDLLTKEDLEGLDLNTETFVVKIADLGYARELTSQSDGRVKSFKGSPLMMAPEQLNTYWDRGSGYSHKIDVWAIGVNFYQMLTGMFIFSVSKHTRR